MISIKKWPWVLLGTVLSLALWTFVSINTGIFESDTGFDTFAYLSSYALIVGFWGLVVLKLDISGEIKKGIGIAMFFLTPLFCMQIAMVLSGAAEYSFGIYFINAMFYVSIMGIFLAITRSFRWSAVITVIIAYIFNMACFVVNIFRGTPLIPSDFLAIGTAAQVAEHYTFDMRYPLVAATVIAAISVTMIIKFPYKPRFKRKNIILPVCGLLTAALFFGALSFVDYSESEMDVFDQYHANNTHGTIYSFYINVRRMILQKPEGYDADAVGAKLASYSNRRANTDFDKPNIIVIMNESLSDLNVVGKFDTNIDYMPFIKSSEENTIKGELLVSPFGGYTCNTEFEFLTGLTMGLLPTGSTPYLQYMNKPVTDALPAYLAQNGYASVALHPYYARCWNREVIYDYLGFEKFVSIENLDEVLPEDEWEYVRYYLSDRTSFKAVTNYIEKEEKPLFLFNVTMQNHGGYTYDGSEFPTVTIESMQGHYPEAEQYISLVRESDKAFEELTENLKNSDEKTIVVMFGDHQPAVEQEFFEELYGKSLDRLSVEEMQQRYKVPFIIWSNFEIESRDNVHISTNYLSNLLLDTAGVPKSAIGNFTSTVHEEIPQINGMGHYDLGGYWHDKETTPEGILKDYSEIEYFAIHGGK